MVRVGSSKKSKGARSTAKPTRPTKGRAKSKGRASDLEWLDVEEAPRHDLPDARKLARRARFLRVTVWMSVIFLPIVLIGMIGMMAGGTQQQSSTAAQSSEGRVVATSVLQAWISSEPAPIPGAQVISWDGAEMIGTREISPSSSRIEPYTITTEQNLFTVGVRRTAAPEAPPTTVGPSGTLDDITDATGTTAPPDQPADDETETTEPGETEEEAETRRRGEIPELWDDTYKVAVLVEIDSRGGVKPISQPSIVPDADPATDGWEEVRPSWPGLADLNAPDPVKTAVSRWSVAYISADPEELRLATGDPTATNRYFPLTGPDAITAVVLGAATADQGETAVVRVRLQPHWPGQPVPTDRRSDVPVAPPFDLDVLVLNAATGSPVVVAWGPPGSGASLEPYENAVVGERPSVSTTTTEPVAGTAGTEDAEDTDGSDAESTSTTAATSTTTASTTTAAAPAAPTTPEAQAPVTPTAETPTGGA